MQSFSQDACSEACALDATPIEVNCNNEGTTDIEDDDTYSITVTIAGINNASTFTEVNSGERGNYGEPFTLSGFLISDGDIVLNFIDDADNNCSIELTASAPAACSDACMISASIITTICDDAGTCLLYTSPSPRDKRQSRMPSSA